MRVLFLNPIGEIGGAERVLLTAIAGIRHAAPDAIPRLVALGDGPLLAAARDAGADAEVVPLPPPLNVLGDSHAKGWRATARLAWRTLTALPAAWQHVRLLRNAVSRFRPDLVHSNGIKTHLLARFAVPRRIPVVWHVHDFYGARPLAARLLRRVRSRAGVAVAVSNAVAEDIRHALPRVPVAVIPNAIDLAHFAPGPGDGDDLDRRAGLPPAPAGTVRVGLVATYARWKGHLTLLDAAKILAAQSPAVPLRWYIVGGPIYHTAAQFTEAELRAAVADRGLAGRVGFIPFTADPAPIYRALDVVVHASTQPEPFGLTVAEAMGCGRAAIVSRAGGAAELFTDGYDAVGVPPGDAGALATAVRRLAEDAVLRTRLGATARATARQRFDQTRYGPQLLAVYQELLHDDLLKSWRAGGRKSPGGA